MPESLPARSIWDREGAPPVCSSPRGAVVAGESSAGLPCLTTFASSSSRVCPPPRPCPRGCQGHCLCSIPGDHEQLLPVPSISSEHQDLLGPLSPALARTSPPVTSFLSVPRFISIPLVPLPHPAAMVLRRSQPWPPDGVQHHQPQDPAASSPSTTGSAILARICAACSRAKTPSLLCFLTRRAEDEAPARPPARVDRAASVPGPPRRPSPASAQQPRGPAPPPLPACLFHKPGQRPQGPDFR